MDDEIDAKYLCPICCEVLKKPLIMPCLHRFCRQCYKESQRHTSLCPICRTSVDPDLCVDDKRLENEISSGTVICQPCGQQFSLLHFNVHATTCTKRKKINPNIASAMRSTFICPLCHTANLDCAGLVKHCNTLHKDNRSQVVCPVCSAMPWGDPQQVSSNFVKHLNIRHTFEYNTFVDYEQDDEQSLKAAIEASLIQN